MLRANGDGNFEADFSYQLDLKRRIPEVDGLRGLAIGLVLVWHFFSTSVDAPPGSVLSYFSKILAATRLCWTGVDLFFVISGFLIGGILLDAKEATNYFRVFYRRRFFRIVPIYAVILIGYFAVKRFVFSGHVGMAGVGEGAAPPWYLYWVFLQNFWMAAHSDLGNNGLGMTWSLAVEEQFYLTLPLIVHLCSRRTLWAAVWLGIVLAPALRIAAHLFWPGQWGPAFFLMPCRADALLLGVLAAMLLRDRRWSEWIEKNQRALVAAILVLLLGVIGLLCFADSYQSALMTTVGYSWIAMFYATLLVRGVTRPETRLGWVLRWGWLGWLGGIAYGTYLMHQNVRQFLFRAMKINPPAISDWRTMALTLAALGVTLAAARVSWEYFEKHMVRIGHREGYEFASRAEVKGGD